MKKIDQNREEVKSSTFMEDTGNVSGLGRELEELRAKVKLLEKEKEVAELSSQSKSEFIAKLSHDLRTPLHAILSYSRFGIDKIDRIDTEKILSYFNKIELSGKKLQAMLNDLVDLAKLESGLMAFQFYNCRIPLIVTSLENEFRDELAEKNLTLQKEIQEGISAVCCDQNKISLVMATFLKDAIELSPVETTITIRIELDRIGEAQENSAIKVSVEDQRTKLLTDEQLIFFQKKWQSNTLHRHVGHHDIGVSIASEIIKYHSGILWAENISERGVCYSFLLPLDQEDQESNSDRYRVQETDRSE